MGDYHLIQQIRKILNEHHLIFENSIEDSESRVKEEFKLMTDAIHTRIMSLTDGNQNHSSTLKLRFRNKIKGPLLTSKIIEGDVHTKVEVELVDETGKVVNNRPDAKLNIVVLKGEFDKSEEDGWTTAEFNENIVGDIPGKRPFLNGNLSPSLQGGVCSLGDIKFRNHTIKVKPPFFRLGVRVVQGPDEVRIREAKTDPFTVKDFRNKYIEKHDIPALSDDLCRLHNVAKGGPVYKRLRENNIHNVEDFLIRLLRDSDGLKKIFNLGEEKWKKTVDQVARACPDGKIYNYENSQKKGVAFNVHGKVRLSHENHKAEVHELLASARKHWDDTVEKFDNEISLKQHLFTCAGKKVDSSGPGKTVVMIGESSQSLQLPSSPITVTTSSAIEDDPNDDLTSTDDNMEITLTEQLTSSAITVMTSSAIEAADDPNDDLTSTDDNVIGESSQNLQLTSSPITVMTSYAIEADDPNDDLTSTDDNMEIAFTEQPTPAFVPFDTEPDFPVFADGATSFRDDSNDLAHWMANGRWKRLYMMQILLVSTSISVKKRKFSN